MAVGGGMNDGMLDNSIIHYEPKRKRRKAAKQKLQDEILKRLNDNWELHNGRARCPGHDGTDKNLAVNMNDGELLLYCHSYGCSYGKILAGLGLGDVHAGTTEMKISEKWIEANRD